MRKPLIFENWDDKNDIISRYNPGKYQNSEGNYWDVAGDLAFMFPMFEMSGEKHYRYLSSINYIYNETNPLNDHKVNMPKVNSTVSIIRNKQPYNLI